MIEEIAENNDLDALIPGIRAFENADGVSFESLGETWLLAHAGLAPELDYWRDKIDDEARLNDSVSVMDCFEAARLMLLVNYELTTFEALSILIKADPDELCRAVMQAMFGGGEGRRTYSEWARSSLYCAGLKVEDIPPVMVPLVLQNLVALGRAVPIDKFTDAAIAAPMLKRARAAAKAHAEKTAGQKAAEAPALDLGIPPEAVTEIIQAAGEPVS